MKQKMKQGKVCPIDGKGGILMPGTGKPLRRAYGDDVHAIGRRLQGPSESISFAHGTEKYGCRARPSFYEICRGGKCWVGYRGHPSSFDMYYFEAEAAARAMDEMGDSWNRGDETI